MKRLFCTSTRHRCPFGCTYCFARFSQYEPRRLPSIEQASGGASTNGIVYPSCDYDLFAIKNPLDIMEPLVASRSSLSISTKATLDRIHIRDIGQVADALSVTSRVLKIGISVTSKTRLEKDEPGTASYEDRLESTVRLRQSGAKVALILKPLLASVSVAEYKSILNDFRTTVHAVLLGLEYLDEAKCRHPLRKRVSWLPGQPSWPYSDLTNYVHALESHCRRIDLPCFTSDIDLMESMVRHAKAR